MKKRFPTLVAIGGVILVFSLLFVKRACSTEPRNQDRDKDGIVNDKDACPDVYAKTHDGCPTKVEKSGDDQDKDGFLGGFQKDTSILDRDDSDPCIPNRKCDYCDLDGDGLTYPQEIAKNTKPTLPDSDGDGVNDKLDRCPLDYGIADNDGCILLLDVMLKKQNSTISWNPELMKHAQSIQLIVTLNNGTEIFNESVRGNKQSIPPHLILRKRCHAELVVNLKNDRAVKVINRITQW
jgi:hypothetical protein